MRDCALFVLVDWRCLLVTVCCIWLVACCVALGRCCVALPACGLVGLIGVRCFFVLGVVGGFGLLLFIYLLLA